MGCTASNPHGSDAILEHFQPPGFPIQPVITRESAMLCNSSWQAIKNQEFEVDGEQPLTGVVYFYQQFYKRLSERSPAFAEYFGEDTRKKGTILVRMTEFMAAVDYDQLEKYQNRLRIVGKSHVGQGIKPWMYAVFVETLVQTICHCLGSDLSEEVHDAWLHLAAFALRGMLPEVIKGGQELEEANMTLSGKSKSQGGSEHSHSEPSRVKSTDTDEGKTEA